MERNDMELPKKVYIDRGQTENDLCRKNRKEALADDIFKRIEAVIRRY